MKRFRLASVLRLRHQMRFRLTLWYTSLTALVLATFVIGVSVAFANYRFDSFNDDLIASLKRTFSEQVSLYLPPTNSAYYLHHPQGDLCIGVGVADPSALTRDGNVIRFYTRDGKLATTPGCGAPIDKLPANSPLNQPVVTKSIKSVAKTTAPSVVNCGNYRCITLPLTVQGQEVIGQIAAPMDRVEQQVAALSSLLIYSAIGVLIVSAMGGWLLIGHALRPIDDITRKARIITAHDLSKRLNFRQDNEIGRMAVTFDDMIARLEESFERQKRFTSDASHELRTPLTVMQADLSLALARKRSSEEYRQTLESMEEEVLRLSSIVNDLLVLTRIDVDPAGIQHQPVALHDILGGLVNGVRVIASERDVRVFAPQLNPVIMVGDATRLRQLFTNLLDNAVTYTPSGGAVTVLLERHGDVAEIIVRDTGIGIMPEDLPHVFERFYRSSKAREHHVHGTGLGLAISRSVVQAHHGEISVESEPGQGTTFTVLLPLDSREDHVREHRMRTLLQSPVAAL